jgi:cytochrome c oxidase subunit 3
MKQEAKDQKVKATNLSTLEKLENLHPYETLMYLGIIASSLVFLFMGIAFSFRVLGNQESIPFYLPKFFTISTLLLLISGFRLRKIMNSFDGEDANELARNLQIVLILGLTFSITQVLGWMEMYDQGRSTEGEFSIVYLYIISAVHLFHLFGGVVFLFYLNYQAFAVKDDSVKQLIFFTNGFQRLKFKLLISYWRFLDLSWLILFLWFFLIF